MTKVDSRFLPVHQLPNKKANLLISCLTNYFGTDETPDYLLSDNYSGFKGKEASSYKEINLWGGRPNICEAQNSSPPPHLGVPGGGGKIWTVNSEHLASLIVWRYTIHIQFNYPASTTIFLPCKQNYQKKTAN